MGEREPQPAGVDNTVEGPVYGAAVQAGAIHGDVVIHNHPPAHGAAVAVVTRVASAPDGPDLVGRDDEVRQVLAALAPGRPSPAGSVVVSGMGGVGKTTLARHCAQTALARGWFPGGAFLVDLQGYRPEGAVSSAAVFSPLLRQLEEAEGPVPGDPAVQAARYDQVLRALAERGRPVLLVLDNVASAEQLRGLLPAGGEHRVLVTTRDTLALPGARRFALGVLSAAEAADVLAATLREHDPRDRRTHHDEAGVRRLAEVCGGLPLALVIAVGLLADEPHLAPGELASQLQELSTAAFVHGETDLSSVFTLSYQRLHTRSPAAARLLHLMAIAPLPDITTDAAAALAGAPAARTRVLLRTLRQAHLLDTGDSSDRWRLHDLVRGHAAEHGGSDEDDGAITRLLDHYLHSARAAQDARAEGRTRPGGHYPGNNPGWSWQITEYHNLMAVQQYAVDSGRHAHAVHLALASHEATPENPEIPARLELNERTLASAERLGDPDALAQILDRLGTELARRNRTAEAVAFDRRAVEAFRAIGDSRREARACAGLGATLWHGGRYEEAVDAFHHAITVFHALGDPDGEGRAADYLGESLRKLGRFEEAVTAYRHAIATYRTAGDHDHEPIAWRRLGEALRELCRYDEAVAAYREMIAIEARRGRELSVADGFLGMASTMEGAGWFEEAADAYERAFTPARSCCVVRARSALLGAAGMRQRQGRYDDAVDTYRRAIGFTQEVKSRHGECEARAALGEALIQAARPGPAKEELEAALSLARSLNRPDLVDRITRTLARL